jgi:hypothetical protein
MRREIARYDARLRRRFVTSRRHTIEVDFHTHLAELQLSCGVAAGAPAEAGIRGLTCQK